MNHTCYYYWNCLFLVGEKQYFSTLNGETKLSMKLNLMLRLWFDVSYLATPTFQQIQDNQNCNDLE